MIDRKNILHAKNHKHFDWKMCQKDIEGCKDRWYPDSEQPEVIRSKMDGRIWAICHRGCPGGKHSSGNREDDEVFMDQDGIVYHKACFSGIIVDSDDPKDLDPSLLNKLVAPK